MQVSGTWATPDMDISFPKKGVPPSSKAGDPVNKTERCGIL